MITTAEFNFDVIHMAISSIIVLISFITFEVSGLATRKFFEYARIIEMITIFFAIDAMRMYAINLNHLMARHDIPFSYPISFSISTIFILLCELCILGYCIQLIYKKVKENKLLVE